jgi:hypothetical protein
LVRKEKEQNLDEMLEDMKSNTPITKTSAGGVARSMLEIFNERIDNTYDYIDANIIASRFSTASGSILDSFGELVGCTRLPNETDGNYRYRITQQSYIAAKSNETAIRMKCLEIDGVNDVTLTPYTRGIGSFTVHVISSDIDTPDDLITKVQKVIDENQATGVRGIAAKPILVPVDIVIRLVLASGVTSQEGNSITYSIRSKIESYIKGLGMGNPINTMDIYHIAEMTRIAEASIETVKINSRTVTGSQAEYLCKWDERYYPREVTVIV